MEHGVHVKTQIPKIFKFTVYQVEI